MKPLPVRIIIALTCICITLGSAIKPTNIKISTVTSNTIDAAKPAATDIIYYWYSDDTDTFDAQRLTSVECRMLTADYGFRVDTDPTGGTPIMDGYQTNANPHITWPFSILYVHY